MTKEKHLVEFSDSKRKEALRRFKIIEPYLKNIHSVSCISKKTKISCRTLYYWIEKYRQHELIGLIPKCRKDRGTMKISNEIETYIKSFFLRNRNISIASIHRQTCNWCEQQNFAYPSYYIVRKVIQSIPKKIQSLAHDGYKEFSNHYELVHIRECERPNEIWQADHTLMDIEVINSKGIPERPWLTIILDDFSRAVAGFSIDFSPPSAIKTSLTLRQAIWRKENEIWPICGIPEKFYTDHGSDFTSVYLEQVAADLKIELIFSRIGIPRGRGKIERFFQTVNTMFLQELPGYIRNKKNSKLLTSEELSSRFEQWLFLIYHQRIHSSIGETPIKKWNQPLFLPNMPESLVDLDLLLMTVRKTRIVRNDGIHLFGLRYLHHNLSAFVGEEVIVRYDPHDITEIRIYHQEMFLGIAVCTTSENRSISLKEIERERNRFKRTLKKEVTLSTREIVEGLNPKEKNSVGSPKKSTLKRYENDD